MDADIPFIEIEAVQTIINSIADAVIVADTSRRIVFMNKAATILWGYSFEELKGKTTECLYSNVDDYE
ncbi:MAG: PAS domain-containing protein, partial [Nitrospiraceae bacterium]